MIDLHCHLLPGVDDGSESMEESLEMARALAGLGFRAVCCTPHVQVAMFSRSTEELQELRDKLQIAVTRAGIPLELLPGGEHHASEVLEVLAGDRLLRYRRRDAFLLEFSLRGFPPRVDEMLFRFQLKGLTVVLAHVERYPEVQADPRALAPLRERGVQCLVNLSSLARRWDAASQASARTLLQAGLVDAVSSDLHDPDGVEAVAEGLAALRELVDPSAFERLTDTTPAILAGLEPGPAGQGA
ncbi:MAG TPA: phosphotransferase [Myxococcota bacterium]|nr:phosphotransferase [Myxococcota bacterium]HRY92681.1 phosphotransferase [Myxococcota bacterium]